MKIKLLSGAIAMCITCPAMADNLMENQTLPGMCTVGTLGVSSGTRAATANFEPDTYECAAGTYLPANAITCATCPAGSFCEGGEYTFNASGDQGAYLCDEMAVSNTTSDSGATSPSDCYLPTLSTCPTISGPTSCDPHAASCAYASGAVTSAKFYPDSNTSTQNCAVTFTCATGYTKRAAGAAPTLPTQSSYNYQHRSHLYPSGGANFNEDNDLSAGEWKVTWTSGTTTGVMKGVASCSTASGTPYQSTMNANLLSNSADASDDDRRYCWCKPTSWTPDGGSAQVLSAAWVFTVSLDRGCASACVSECAIGVSSTPAFRSAVFGTIGTTEICVPNDITLNWGDGNGGIHATNSCSYDGAITTPATAPTAPRGHVFTGWSFE